MYNGKVYTEHANQGSLKVIIKKEELSAEVKTSDLDVNVNDYEDGVTVVNDAQIVEALFDSKFKATPACEDNFPSSQTLRDIQESTFLLYYSDNTLCVVFTMVYSVCCVLNTLSNVVFQSQNK